MNWLYKTIDLYTNTLKAQFYGHGFSGQYCYDGTTVFSNSGNFNIEDTVWSKISSIFPFYP